MKSVMQRLRSAVGRREVTLICAIVVVIGVPFTVLFVWADDTMERTLLTKLGETLIQLAFIGVLGVIAKSLIDDYSAERQRKADLQQARLSVLNATTSSYWQIKKAFHLIDAHQSALTYGKQMQEIMDYRLQLQRIDNEVISGMYKFKDNRGIATALTEMDKVLECLQGEWKRAYLPLARLQQADEKEPDPEKKRVPDELARLPWLTYIRNGGDFEPIHSPFERAVTPMRIDLGFQQPSALTASEKRKALPEPPPCP